MNILLLNIISIGLILAISLFIGKEIISVQTTITGTGIYLLIYLIGLTLAIPILMLGFKLNCIKDKLKEGKSVKILVGGGLLVIYTIFVWLPEELLLNDLSDSGINLFVFFLRMFLSAVIVLIPFYIATGRNNKRALVWYSLTVILLSLISEFNIVTVEDQSRFLYFWLQPSYLIIFGLIPWLLANLVIPQGNEFFSWRTTDNFTKKEFFVYALFPLVIIFLFLGRYDDVTIGQLSPIGLVTTITFIFIYAFQEEVFFRGFIFSLLKRYSSRHLAVILSVLIFSLSHISNYLHLSFELIVLNLLVIALLGLIYQLIYIKSQNLWYSIGLHSFANLIFLLSN